MSTVVKKREKLLLGELLELKRWNTPTIYNGWEQITQNDPSRECFNLEQTVDFMPQLGPMVGYAITVVVEPGNPVYKRDKPENPRKYREYVASVEGPKIVVVQDLDKPNVYGSFWGEINSNIHKALGCVGTITDGAIRDLDEITNAGFKAIARRMCVGHAFSCPVRWDCEVEVFGTKIKPGQLIHADKHGFLVVPNEDLSMLLEAASFMDSNECQTMISVARSSAGKSSQQILNEFNEAAMLFREKVKNKFRRKS
jgi:4-hydroxy-4-methyl-2-oxoglutarate aldolase